MAVTHTPGLLEIQVFAVLDHGEKEMAAIATNDFQKLSEHRVYN